MADIIDIEGNVYKTIQIGTQTWMAENLKTTRYRNGDSIHNETVNSTWVALSTGSYCWYYNDSSSYKATYGALYNWFAVNDSRNLAPKGWHIPTDDEWSTLTTYLGGVNVAGYKIKETGNMHWVSLDASVTNISGFTALPSGYRRGGVNYGTFGTIRSQEFMWTSTENSATDAKNALVVMWF